jgi:hypothetical protein
MASLEAFRAREGANTEPEVILGLEEARERLESLSQRRQVLVEGWRQLCVNARRIHTECR